MNKLKSRKRLQKSNKDYQVKMYSFVNNLGINILISQLRLIQLIRILIINIFIV
jgi:hypothetical protein